MANGQYNTNSFVGYFSFFLFSPAIPAPRWHSPAYHQYVERTVGRYELRLFSRFAEISRKREPNAAAPTIMFHEVATLVHLIESSKPEALAEDIRLIVLLEVP